MPEKKSKFHEFALQSILFKGRPDWYFCYLKAERLAHVLTLLSAGAEPIGRDDVAAVAHRAGGLSSEVAHLAAGEIEAPVVLADVFGLLSLVRLLGARGFVHQDTASILVREYEQVAERLARGSHPSPFMAAEELQISLPESSPELLPPARFGGNQLDIKDKDTKGHSKTNKGQTPRMSLILDLVRKRKSLSIKEISAVIRDCSEKTIQRELALLIEQGLIRKVGERRWSVYEPA